MNSEGKFWVSVWVIAGAVVVTVAALIYASNKHEDDVKAQMVKQGYTPQEVMCAFPKTSSDKVLCANLVTKGEK